jgi:hypothetical protein
VAACSAREGDLVASRALMEVLDSHGRDEGYHGPRAAIFWALDADTKGKYRVGRTDVFPGRGPLWHHVSAQAPKSDSGTGVIAKITKQGATLRIDFPKAANWKKSVERCRETNKIHGIDADGQIIYRKMQGRRLGDR